MNGVVKIKRKIDSAGTIKSLQIGQAVTFKISAELSANKVRAAVARLRKNGMGLDATENGLEIKVTRIR